MTRCWALVFCVALLVPGWDTTEANAAAQEPGLFDSTTTFDVL